MSFERGFSVRKPTVESRLPLHSTRSEWEVLARNSLSELFWSLSPALWNKWEKQGGGQLAIFSPRFKDLLNPSSQLADWPPAQPANESAERWSRGQAEWPLWIIFTLLRRYLTESFSLISGLLKLHDTQQVSQYDILYLIILTLYIWTVSMVDGRRISASERPTPSRT